MSLEEYELLKPKKDNYDELREGDVEKLLGRS